MIRTRPPRGSATIAWSSPLEQAIPKSLFSRTAKSLGCPPGVFQSFDLLDWTGENGDRNHLRDLLPGVELLGDIAQVGHHDEDLAPVARIDHAARRRQSPRRHRR